MNNLQVIRSPQQKSVVQLGLLIELRDDLVAPSGRQLDEFTKVWTGRAFGFADDSSIVEIP